MKKILFISLLCFLSFSTLFSQTSIEKLDEKAETIWQALQPFYSQKTKVFNGYIPENTPPPEDIKKFLPLKKNGSTNWHGGMSGIEDNALFNGTLLSSLIDQYKITKNPIIAKRAKDLFNGLKLNATAHGDKGFVARGVSPHDAKTVYPGTSVDQYTHFIYGMLKYYRSPIATEFEKKEIAKIFTDIAEKMIREIRPDTTPPYSFKFYKGMPDDRGTGKMMYTDEQGKLYPSMRLPMIYIATYATTKNQRYLNLYEKYIDSALEHEFTSAKNYEKDFKKWSPAYVAIQRMYALDIVKSSEKNQQRIKFISQTMDEVANAYTQSKYFSFEKDKPKKRGLRDCAELLHAKTLAPSYKLEGIELETFLRCMKIIWLKNKSYSGSFPTLLGAYWSARATNKLKLENLK